MAKFSHHRGHSKKRAFEWARTNYSKLAAVGTDQVDLLLGFRNQYGITANSPDWTLTRIRGMINFTAAQVSALPTGMIVVAAIVEDVNVAGLPTPVAQPHEDWLMYQVGNPQNGFAGGTANVTLPIAFDSKAMRKLHQMQRTVWLVWESINGANTYTAEGMVSAGFKLP
jgi:hypothetical protein